MEIFKCFESKAKQLFWRTVDPAHASGTLEYRLIEPGKAYFTIRLCEMYLGAARKLWHQIYPMVHAYTKIGAVDTHAIASPAQLRELGDSNLDLLANLNVRLAGPLPYAGEEVSLLVGLYAIPGHDSAKALIDVMASFSSLDPSAIGRASALALPIKNGIEAILGLDQATLHLGIRDSFNPASRALESGYFIGIAAPEQTVDASQLWVANGRLLKGKDLASAAPYTDHDYILLAIEHVSIREEWSSLPELQDLQKKFANIISDVQFSASEKRSRLAALWPGFVQTLSDSTNLTEPDCDRIAGLVSGGLIKSLKIQEESNPFLPRA